MEQAGLYRLDLIENKETTFIYPELDRFKSGSSTETIKIDDRIKKICNDIISKYNIDSYSRRICSQAKSFLVEYRNDNTVNVILDELF